MATHYTLPLIGTKLAPPGVCRDLIDRRRLVARLNERRPVTVVVAPAGYGKSTLLSAWLVDLDRPAAWLSLDRMDNDPSTFLTYVIAALRTVDPNAGRSTQSLATRNGSMPPPWPVIGRSLVSDVEAIARPFVLVLDDYHEISDPECHALLAELARRPLDHLQLVVASRRAVPLPMGRLRASDLVTEIRAEDLRCSADEARLFLRRSVGDQLDDATALRLAQETEGWLAGLRMVAVYVRGQGDAAVASDALSGRPPTWRALEYLAEEVLAEQPAVVQECLVRASILERLCAGLCAALTDGITTGADGQSFLDRVEDEGLFVVPLDDVVDGGRRWYRLNHLFRDLLRHRLRQNLPEDDVADLHRRAGDWFAAHHFVEEALSHYLAAGDEPSAVSLVEAHRHQAMNREEWSRLERWLRLLPRKLVEQQPELVLMEAWAWLQRFRWPDLPERVERATSLLADRSTPPGDDGYLWGEVHALKGQLHLRVAEAQPAAELARRALRETPLDHSAVRGVAWACLATSIYTTGDTEVALGVLYEALQEDRDPASYNPTLILMALGFTHWMMADPARMALAAERLLAVGQDRQLPAALGWGYYFRGCGRYVTNDLQGAADDFELVAGQHVVGSGAAYPQSVFGLALVDMARGRFERPLALADSMVALALEMANTDLLAEAEIFRGLVALRSGRPADAARWIAPYIRGLPLGPLYTLHAGNVTLARVLVGLASPEHDVAAAQLLINLQALVQATHNTRFTVDVLALTAVLHDRQGDHDGALAAVTGAARLAESGGLVRALADLRPELDPLLASLDQQGVDRAFLAAVRTAPVPGGPEASRVPAVPVPDIGASGPLERLTFREMDVLRLLCQRMTNREIAHALGISPETVKKHAANIYGKLQVRDRRQAAARARAWGLVTSP